MPEASFSPDDYAWALSRAFGKIPRVRREQIIKLYQVCAQMGVGEQTRRGILKAAALQPGKLGERPVAKSILDNKEASAMLARDYMLMVAGAAGEAEDPEGQAFVRAFVSAAALGADQVRVLRDWVVLENKVLRAMGAGEEWMANENDWRELGSRAAGVGLPVTALYFAGITGFSAVGITSGLAAIGGTAGAALVALGLNPMTAGIAVLIGGGIAIKKIADYALGVKSKKQEAEEERARRIELLVNTVGLLGADREAFPAMLAGANVIDPRPSEALRGAMSEAFDGLKKYSARAK